MRRRAKAGLVSRRPRHRRPGHRRSLGGAGTRERRARSGGLCARARRSARAFRTDAIRTRRRRRSPPARRPSPAFRTLRSSRAGRRARRCPTEKRASSPGCAVITAGSPRSSRSAPVPSSWGRRGSSTGVAPRRTGSISPTCGLAFPRPASSTRGSSCATAASGPRGGSPRGSISPWRWSRRTTGTAWRWPSPRGWSCFLRRSGNQAQFSSALQRQEKEPSRLRDISTFVLEHVDEALPVNRIAAGIGMSPRTLSRWCRAALRRIAGRVGAPPSDRRGPASPGGDSASLEGHHRANRLRRCQHDVARLHAASRRHASRLPTALRGHGDRRVAPG